MMRTVKRVGNTTQAKQAEETHGHEVGVNLRKLYRHLL